jgi:hypothetical protein
MIRSTKKLLPTIEHLKVSRHFGSRTIIEASLPSRSLPGANRVEPMIRKASLEPGIPSAGLCLSEAQTWSAMYHRLSASHEQHASCADRSWRCS